MCLVIAMKIKLKRPLVFFDIESTGLNRNKDRIIDLAMVKVNPDGSRLSVSFRVNPEYPISAEAMRIHGISEEDVKDSPPFRAVARDIAGFLDGCDLAGFNIIHFDVPMLESEFKRAKVDVDLGACVLVDAQKIYHRMEPRDLGAALHFYCGVDHVDAHEALGDVEATIRVLEGQCERYGDTLPDTVEQLGVFCQSKDGSVLDREGKLRWGANDDVYINFGQNKGKSLRELAEWDRSFLGWMAKSDFPPDVKRIVQDALKGEFPKRVTV